MRRIRMMILLSLGLVVPTVAFGKSLYVRDTINEALIRTGPSTEHKIIVILKSGQEVTFVGEQDGYYIVSAPSGSQGYVLKHHMTEQSPAEKRIREIEQRSQQKVQELETQTQAQKKELITLREEREKLEIARKEAEERAQQHAEMVAQLQAQQSARENDEALQWFLAGAGVLLMGVLFGRLWGGAAKKNKRNGLLLS